MTRPPRLSRSARGYFFHHNIGPATVRRSFKYRLRPGRNAERELFTMKETHRRLYNACLDQRKTAYEGCGMSVRYGDQSAWYKGQRRVNPFFARMNFSSAQATMRRLD